MLAFVALPVGAQDNTTTDTNATAGGNETATDNETVNQTTGDAAGGAGGDELGVPADAPAPAEGKIVRVLTIGVVETGTCADGQAAPCWDVTTLAANPGDVVVLHANLKNSDNFHNLHMSEEDPMTVDSPGAKSQTAGSAVHTVSLVMPESGKLNFICDVHPQSMIGSIVTPEAAAAAGGGHAAVPTLGVHFLAYWVGVIAFALLFIVYGLTFFLFKYNETPAATDHWDRSESAPENKRLAPYASLLAVVLAIAAIAAIIFIATR